MPRKAGRGVLFAALAVPFALVVAPLHASAEEPDDTVVTEALQAAGVATMDGAAAMATATTTTATETEDVEEDNEAYYGLGPDWYPAYADDDSYEECYEDSYDPYDADEDTAVQTVAVVPVAVADDDDDYVDWTPNDWTAASYDELTAHAGSDGAWVTSTESGAYSDGHGLTDGDSGAYYEDVTAAAGNDGAYIESVSSAAVESDGWHDGWHDNDWSDNDWHDSDWHDSDWSDWHDDDDATGAYYEELTAHAGSNGAWVDSTESAAGELD